MSSKTFVIEFRLPEGNVYAGMHKGAFGFAPTLKTACFYSDEEDAIRVLKNGYGGATAEWGYVTPVEAGA